MFSALIRSILPADFYARPPAMMNGYLVEVDTAKSFCKTLPSMAEMSKIFGADNVEMAFDLISPKVFIPTGLAVMPLHCVMHIWNFLFTGRSVKEVLSGKEPLPIGEGSHALIIVLLALLGLSRENMQSKKIVDTVNSGTMSVNLYVQMQKLIEKVEEESFEVHFVDAMRKVPLKDVLEGRARAKEAKAKTWSSRERLVDILHGLDGDEESDENKGKGGKLTLKELTILQEQFRKICGETKTTGLDVRQLAEVFCSVPAEALPMPPADLAIRLFERWDDDKSGKIDFRELVCILSSLGKGSMRKRLAACFDLYDKDGSGEIDDFEARDLARALCKTSSVAAYGSKAMKEDKIRRLFLKIKMADTDGNGSISFDEFYNVVLTDEVLLHAMGFGDEEDHDIGGLASVDVTHLLDKVSKEKDSCIVS